MSGSERLRMLVPVLDDFAGGCPELPAWFAAARAAEHVEIADYSPGIMIRERWDVIYVYWPEWCVRRDRGLGVTAFDAARLLAEFGVAKLRGAKVVWHANNVLPHESDRLGLVDTFVRGFAHLVDQIVACTQTVLDDFVRHYPVLRAIDQRVIPIGHYRDFYPDRRLTRDDARAVLGLPTDVKIAMALGMVRAYKNLVPLVRCFRDVVAHRKDVMLVVAGKPLPEELGERLRYECRDLDSVRLDLKFIPDDDLQYYLRAANFVAVPTTLATTSGSAMLALSFDRPVVIPHRAEYLEWREQLGETWLHTYEGGIRPGVLDRAFDAAPPEGRPPLERYHDWSSSSQRLLQALTELVRGVPKPVPAGETVH
jgi:beta-1,4-mannosyltransferase